ncbi:hypothetical protein [Williamsia muralis]|uniref:SMODS and SLOG-associating 2TM effector domain-containing protein n=1 Tax=Williamsia marianensis TaxID=85044 RepID=A0ABU4F2S0_WILMA|nr:hypothetical protein [Williamsia muralis]MDV7137172.1 hypothetical protein [Williamsia muralis]
MSEQFDTTPAEEVTYRRRLAQENYLPQPGNTYFDDTPSAQWLFHRSKPLHAVEPSLPQTIRDKLHKHAQKAGRLDRVNVYTEPRARLATPIIVGAQIIAFCATFTTLAYLLVDPLYVDEFLTSALVSIAAMATAAIAHWYRRNDPLAFTYAERNQIAAARRRWDKTPGALQPAHPRELTTPAALAIVAYDTTVAIERNPAWTSAYLHDHRVRLDLAEEREQIAANCRRLEHLHQLSNNTQPDTRDTSTHGQQLTDTHQHYIELAAEATHSIENRIAALITYQRQLVPIEGLITNLARLDTLHTHHPDFAAEYTAITNNNLATHATNHLTTELDTIREGLRTELHILAATTRATELETPLRLQLPE